MPDLGYLLERLKNGTWISVNVPTPRNLILDNNGYLVTVEMQPPKLDRFDARNLSLISRMNISGTNAMGIGFTNNAYFVGINFGPIYVIDSSNLSVLRNISSPLFQKVRGIIFLNQGRTMVIAATQNPTVIFFNQTTPSVTSYSYAYHQVATCPFIHGLLRWNDTLFYGTSWSNNSIYSYTAIPNSTIWHETLFIDANPILNISGGTYVTIDECGRYWFSLEMSVVNIFDNQGAWLANFSLLSGLILDTLITDNYVMYFSDRNTSGSRIIRIDPQIQC